MNKVQEFLLQIESYVPEELRPLYEEAKSFTSDNFGEDDWETIDFDIEDEVIVALNEKAHNDRVTLNYVLVSAIRAAVEEAEKNSLTFEE